MSERDNRPTDDELTRVVGAILFATDEPVTAREIARSLTGVEVGEIDQAIEQLERRYDKQGMGLRVERIAGGVRLATRPEVGAWVRQFFRQRNRSRLSFAALETLAIVAYRQPVTVPEIQAIRGKDPSAAVRGLLDKKLLRGLGRKKVIGNPLLYGTSKEFLVHFGLDSLEDLPSIEEFDQFLEVLQSRAEGADDEGLLAQPVSTAPRPPDVEA